MTMKKNVNGVVMDMTEEEIKAYEEWAAKIADMPPTESERIEALESALLELAGVLYNG